MMTAPNGVDRNPGFHVHRGKRAGGIDRVDDRETVEPDVPLIR